MFFHLKIFLMYIQPTTMQKLGSTRKKKKKKPWTIFTWTAPEFQVSTCELAQLNLLTSLSIADIYHPNNWYIKHFLSHWQFIKKTVFDSPNSFTITYVIFFFFSLVVFSPWFSNKVFNETGCVWRLL